MIIKTKSCIIAELEGNIKKLIQENENLKDEVSGLKGKLEHTEHQYKMLRWKFWIMLAVTAVCIIYFITQWY